MKQVFKIVRAPVVKRDGFESFTHGRMYLDGVTFCHTCEDEDRQLENVPGHENSTKVYGKTAIPRGKYRIIIDWSNRFKRELPRLLDVPNYVGVRIHPGNGPEDTEGCILPGTGIPSNRQDWLLNSRAAFDALFNKIEAALELGEEVWIEVA